MSARRALCVRWSRRARLTVPTVTVLGGVAATHARHHDQQATDETRGGLDG